MPIPRVTEAYRDWQPRRNYSKLTTRLLGAIPERYLTGLSAIVLTNSSALNHDRRRGKTRSRRRVVPISRCLGLYHPRSRGSEPWIEVFVDRVDARLGGFARRLSLFRELSFARTLYHEVGHHIHTTQVPEHREREDVADSWRDRLCGEMIRHEHPYLRLASRPFRPFLAMLGRFIRWRISRLKARAA